MTPTPWAMDAARALVPLPGFVIGLSDIARALDGAREEGRREGDRHGRIMERLDVVKWLRTEAGFVDVAASESYCDAYATAIDYGAHVPAAADAGRADRGEG